MLVRVDVSRGERHTRAGSAERVLFDAAARVGQNGRLKRVHDGNPRRDGGLASLPIGGPDNDTVITLSLKVDRVEVLRARLDVALASRAVCVAVRARR